MNASEILDEIERARQDVKRTERAYSVCLLTDSLCRSEQREFERAQRRLSDLQHKLRELQKRKVKE